MLGHLAFLAPFTTGSYVTCERLLLGTPFTAAFGAGSLPLCIQLDALAKAPGVEMKMSVDPPTAGVCFRVEMLTAPRSIRQEQRCLDAAGNEHCALVLSREARLLAAALATRQVHEQSAAKGLHSLVARVQLHASHAGGRAFSRLCNIKFPDF